MLTPIDPMADVNPVVQNGRRGRWVRRTGSILVTCLLACSLDREPAAEALSPGVEGDAAASQADASPAMSEPLRIDGEACDQATQCASGHCDRGLCCADGLCCTEASQCDQGAGMAAMCEEPKKCQGTRGEVVCKDFRCTTRQGIPDDRACDKRVVADECGLYRGITCNGEAEQEPQGCPTSCKKDEECDEKAHCDETCRADQRDGERCDEDSDCASAHCKGGVCCKSGDCCQKADDCASYGAPARCTEPIDCQGERVAATCRDFVCGSEVVQDDSGCGRELRARTCGPSADQFCNGRPDQRVECPGLCLDDDDSLCDADAHCDGRYCTADLRDGERCVESSDCQTNHCDNGLCCASGECCQSDAECPGRMCTASYQCAAIPMPMPPMPMMP